MGLFNGFKKKDINEQVKEFRNTKNALLIDVREKDEHADNRIAGSINIPLSSIGDIEKIVKDKSTVLYLYCRSGRRSGQACQKVKKMGYTNARNIGGIIDYKPEN